MFIYITEPLKRDDAINFGTKLLENEYKGSKIYIQEENMTVGISNDKEKYYENGKGYSFIRNMDLEEVNDMNLAGDQGFADILIEGNKNIIRRGDLFGINLKSVTNPGELRELLKPLR